MIQIDDIVIVYHSSIPKGLDIKGGIARVTYCSPCSLCGCQILMLEYSTKRVDRMHDYMVKKIGRVTKWK